MKVDLLDVVAFGHSEEASRLTGTEAALAIVEQCP